MVKVKTPGGPSGEDASGGDILDSYKTFETAATPQATVDSSGPDWLNLARASYESSSQFVESSLRNQWEKNERAFQNRHPSGSKYFSESYRSRSALFRPKTRAMIRQAEAQLAQAFFSNEDIVSRSE